MTEAALSRRDFVADQEVRWCPGCGDYSILANMQRVMPELGTRNLRLASWSLVGASFLLPGGFFLGGMFFYSGDPGLGVALVPVGGTLLGLAIYMIARSTEHLRQMSPAEKQKSKK